MPTWALRAFFDAMPALRAQESIDTMTAVAVGGGKLKRQDSDRIVNGWRREIRQLGPPPPKMGFVAFANTRGIRIVNEPRNV